MSPPLGPPEQPHFVNAAVALLTRLSPRELLAACQDIERRQGRRRDGERWGPRTLDLDILVYGDLVASDTALTVPHPELANRPFVLGPLAEIAPALRVPGLGSVAELARRSDLASLEPVSTADEVA